MYYRKILRQYLVQKILENLCYKIIHVKQVNNRMLLRAKYAQYLLTPIGIYLYGDLLSPFLKE